MTLAQLRMLIVLANTNSMNLCAQSLGINKSNVSQTIASLERELGVQLFFKSHTGSYLTPAGEKVYQHAKKVIEECEAILSCENAAEKQRPLRILYPDAQNDLVQEFMGLLSKIYPSDQILLTCTPVPHLCSPETLRNIDIIGGMIIKKDLNQLDALKEEYLIYDINESPLVFIMAAGPEDGEQLCADGVTSDDGECDIPISDLVNYRHVVTVNPPIGDEKPASALDRYFERHNLAGKLNITQCNSYTMFWHFLRQGYSTMYGAFDAYRLGGQNLGDNAFSVQRIVPEETVVRYLMIKENSPYFSDISESMATLFNKFGDRFSHTKRIN